MESLEKDLKAPLLNNIALCLIKEGKLERANYFLDKVLQVDATNFKAWQRKITNLINMEEFEEAKKAMASAEKFADTIEEKS